MRRPPHSHSRATLPPPRLASRPKAARGPPPRSAGLPRA